MIELRGVSKTFVTGDQRIEACRNVNLTIEDGEIFGIIGFSGAGKSTLIRCINLLERPTSGSVWIDGREISGLREAELRRERKKIGMIFQHFNLMRSRMIFDNVAYPLKGSGMSRDQIGKKVGELLKLVELEDKAQAYPSQLSGGQKQRVAIARALANDPKVLLCDEATSALDPQTTQSILKLLKQVNHQLGITIILITHQMSVIKEICDRVAVMEEGEIRETGRVIDLFAHPQQTITRSFIATTSNISRIDDLIREGASITRLQSGETMALLSYNTVNTNQALISRISRDYQVDANIIFGNIEVIQNQPLGRLVVIFSGEKEKVEQAMAELTKAQVKVEVIQSC